MLAYNDLINQAPAEYRDALGQEWKLYDGVQENAKIVLAEVGIETRNKNVISLLEATGLAFALLTIVGLAAAMGSLPGVSSGRAAQK